MRYFLLLMIWIGVFASEKECLAITHGEPSSIINGCVSAITGDYFINEEDIYVKGQEPISIPKVYFSRFRQATFGGWSHFKHLQITHTKDTQAFSIVDPTGAKLTYYIENLKKANKRLAKGKSVWLKLSEGDYQFALTNCSNETVSARTNLYNQRVELTHDKNWVNIYGADGSLRCYGLGKFSKKTDQLVYLLKEEQRPNGARVFYTYGKHGELLKVATYSPDKSICYAWLNIQYHYGDKANVDYKITTSDSKTYNYHFHHMRQPKALRDPRDYYYLQSVESNARPKESLSYLALDVTANAFLKKRSFPEGRFQEAEFRDGKVSALLAPAGKIYTFNYQDRCTEVIDALGNKTTYHYNDALRLTAIERPKNKEVFVWGRGRGLKATLLMERSLQNLEGQQIYTRKFVYDQSGNPIEEHFIDQDDAAVIKRSYNKANLLVHEKAPNGLITKYTYKPGTDLLLAKLSVYQNKILRRHFFVYDKNHILIKEIIDDGSTPDLNDITSVAERRIKKIIPKNTQPFIGLPQTVIEGYQNLATGQFHELHREAYTYDKHGNITECKTPFYKTTTHYDSFDYPTLETNALGQKAYRTFDAFGNMTVKKDDDGSSSFYTYDKSNRLTQKNHENHKTYYSYNAKSERISTTDLRGHVTAYEYDEMGNCISTINPLGGCSKTKYDAGNRPIKEIDANDYVTNKTYNGRGKLLSVIYPDDTSESFAYDPSGQLVTHTLANGTTIHYTYDPFGRTLTKTTKVDHIVLLQESWTYSGFRLLCHIDAMGYKTHYQYDYAGRKIGMRREGHKKTYAYDQLNRLYKTITHNRENTLVHTTEYDLLDRPIKETNHTRSISYTYDNYGNQNSKSDANGTHHYEYDIFGRVVAHIDPLGHKITTDYDDENNVITKTNPAGLKAIETYDALNRLTSTELKKNRQLNLETYAYDAVGNCISQVSMIHSPNRTRTTKTAWKYDSRSRPITLIEAVGTPHQRATHTKYTSTGRIASITKPSQKTIKYGYDALDRQTAIDGKNLHYIYEYDKLNRIISAHDGSHRTTRTYDAHGNLTKETLGNGFTLISAYDRANNRTSLTLPDQSIIVYGYAFQDLISVRYKNMEHRYKYDQAGNVISEKLPFNLGEITHTVDALNRTTKKTNRYNTCEILQFGPAGNILKDNNRSYTYDDLSHIIDENPYDSHHNPLHTTPNELNELTSTSYDPDGNPAPHAYDILGRATKIGSDAYTYDPFHRRIYTNQIPHIYDGQNELGTPDQLRILGRAPKAEIGAAIGLILDSKTYIPIHDLYGHVSCIVSSDGTLAESYDYTPFKCLTPSSINPWRYFSKREDASGYINFGRRLYDPTNHRFLTPDPLGHNSHPNLYQFNYGNPLTYTDPYGEFAFTIGIPLFVGGKLLLSTAVGAAVTAGVSYGLSKLVTYANTQIQYHRQNPSYLTDSLVYLPLDLPISPTMSKKKTSEKNSDDSIWEEGSPFKNKDADELDESFIDKGFIVKGFDPKSGKGSYVNPNNGRQYHIDPLESGRYREKNHVDVSRPKDYEGSLDKKKFAYQK